MEDWRWGKSVPDRVTRDGQNIRIGAEPYVPVNATKGSASEPPALPDGWDYLRLSIPIDRTAPVDGDEVAQLAADAARNALDDQLTQETKP